MLSWSQVTEARLHPCTHFFSLLSPAERNYDVGNQELLVVKLALEEWRHWLEGAEQQFVGWINHKNLEHIQSAKLLPVLLGTFFKNMILCPTSSAVRRWPQAILPASCVEAEMTLEIESLIRNAQQSQSDLGGGPPGCMFAPGSF